jgi:sedoheptulose-bisphosphatase
MNCTATVQTRALSAPVTRVAATRASSKVTKAVRANFFGSVETMRQQPRMAASQKAARSAVRVNAKVGDTLEEFLMEATSDAKLRQLMMSMSEAIRTIAFKVRTASCGATACVNSFGDEQLAVDLLADKLLFEALRYSGCCKLACSEEVPEPLDMGGNGFSVAFDPLDGSSIVDPTSLSEPSSESGRETS